MSFEVFSAGERPLGPLSKAVKAGGFVFIAGTVGTRADGSLATTIEEQTEQTLENVRAQLEAAGVAMKDVVKVTVYVTEPEQYGAMNEVYKGFFSEPYPARETVCTRLIFPTHLIEMSAVAVVPGG